MMSKERLRRAAGLEGDLVLRMLIWSRLTLSAVGGTSVGVLGWRGAVIPLALAPAWFMMMAATDRLTRLSAGEATWG